MFSFNILDTLIINDAKITYKSFHIIRTQETFKFLGEISSENLIEIEKIYANIELQYFEKLKTNECLRIVFLPDFPLKYTVEIHKIQNLSPIINLNSVSLKCPKALGSAFKWENRENWNLLLQEKKIKTDDILVVNMQNDIVETSRFNIFLYDESKQIVITPKLDSGCLNGVFRRFVLDEGIINLPQFGNIKVIEKNIQLTDINNYKLFVGNSVRGVLKAVLN